MGLKENKRQETREGSDAGGSYRRTSIYYAPGKETEQKDKGAPQSHVEVFGKKKKNLIFHGIC